MSVISNIKEFYWVRTFFETTTNNSCSYYKDGKSLLFPNFERVDRMFGEKHRVVTNWNTTFGKIVYYVFMLLGLFFLSVAIFNIVA